MTQIKIIATDANYCEVEQYEGPMEVWDIRGWDYEWRYRGRDTRFGRRNSLGEPMVQIPTQDQAVAWCHEKATSYPRWRYEVLEFWVRPAGNVPVGSRLWQERAIARLRKEKGY